MNNEQQTWILKHNLNPETMRPILLKNGWEEEYIEHFFEELFQPLDVSGLTRQIEELLDNYYETRFDVYTIFEETDFHDTKRSHEAKRQAVEQIVLLLLNQEGETEGSGENKQTNKEKEIR